MDPVIAKVHPHKGEPPGPGRVPGQLHQTVPVPHIHVGRQLTASHQQAEGGRNRDLCQCTLKGLNVILENVRLNTLSFHNHTGSTVFVLIGVCSSSFILHTAKTRFSN